MNHCDCSRPAARKVGRSWICDRCLELEGNYNAASRMPVKVVRIRPSTEKRRAYYRWYNNTKRKRKVADKLLPGEITMKEWHECQAAKLGISRHNHEMRVHRGTLPGPEFVRRLNARVVFVQMGS